jgi:hypothetical protein
MIKVVQLDSYEETKSAFNSKGIEFGPFHFCSAVFDGEEKIGECFYKYDDDCVIIKDIFPKGDLLLIDGILRSVFFVASNKGIENAFYENKELEPIYEKLGFLLDKDYKSLKLKKIFEACSGCKN